MRVGWHGILQTVADMFKLLLKEDIVPAQGDKLLHLVAPFLTFLGTLLAIMMLPMSPVLQVADVNIGVLYVTAVSGFGVFGILLGGGSSNNKWSLLGAVRAGAQIISYEISATLALLVVVLFSGTLQLSQIVQSQADGWWIWRAPVVGFVSFVIFMVAATAEINRTPFDLLEADSEIVAGFNIEYSGMKFAMFFLTEYCEALVVSAITTTLFLGGWKGPLLPPFLWA